MSPTKQYKRAVPRRVDHKQIFCIDLDGEMNEMMGPSADGGQVECLMNSSISKGRKQDITRLQMSLSLIKRFISLSLLFTSQDKFSIITMTEKAGVNMYFENDLFAISEAIEGLEATDYYRKFDTQSLFETIESTIDLEDDSVFTQAIVIYGRTQTIPLPVSSEIYNRVRCSPNFTMDFVYIHGPSREYHECQRVFDFWSHLDSSQVQGWYYEFGRLGKSSFTRAMSQLIAHPLQRGNQMYKKLSYFWASLSSHPGSG